MGIKLTFMGTATFAVPSLNYLFEKGYEIGGVVTQPDKPSGRGQSLQASPIKKRAYELQLPVYQPASLRTEEARQLIHALSPDIIVVVAYGKILPSWLLELPRYGCINLHGSLLPQYRGAAPVHWAVANGESKTGVCTMLLDEGLDTGPLYLSKETTIDQDEGVAELYDRLALQGAPLLHETLEGIIHGSLRATPQDHSRASLAPPLKKENGVIDWNLPAGQIHNRVRAFNPWPGTVTKFRGAVCKVLKTKLGAPVPAAVNAGSILFSKGRLAVACGDGVSLEILSIQPENRKAVSGSDFANGARVQADEKFGSVVDN